MDSFIVAIFWFRYHMHQPNFHYLERPNKENLVHFEAVPSILYEQSFDVVSVRRIAIVKRILLLSFSCLLYPTKPTNM